MSIISINKAATFCCLIVLLGTPLLLANDLNTGGQKGIVHTLSTESLGKTGIMIGGAFKYSTEMEYVAGPYGGASVITTANDRAVGRSAPHLFSGNLFTAYGLTSFWDIGIDLPLYYDLPGWDDLHRSGFGDLELTTKITPPWGRNDAFLTNAYSLKIILPTGNTNHGFFARHVYFLTSDNINDTDAVFAVKSVYFNPQIIWSLDFSRLNARAPFLLHANFGGVIATMKSNSALVAAIGLEYRPTDLLTLFTEISGESRVKWYTEVFKITDFINDPFWLTPGMKITIPNGLYMILAGDIGISKKSARFRYNFSRKGYAYSTKALPRYGVQFTLGWEAQGAGPDRDGDGIPDKNDKCQFVAEDIDGFEDTDGCPDLDNDNDGILDARDSCPLEAAVCSGCPILDKDGDKINDNVDKCPDEPEDFDGYTDLDGCPDFDNDNDDIRDNDDKCPTTAEDKDGFEDTDGCPDLDNDGDGIPDIDDKCPAVKGIAENGGCPKTEEIRGKLILDGVNFESGKATLTIASYAALNRVYESLNDWENVRVEICGHTDNQGNDQLNLRLSQQRAETVMQYLINKGISSSRLRAIGYGESTPIADNRTSAGRALNRRVELKRID